MLEYKCKNCKKQFKFLNSLNRHENICNYGEEDIKKIQELYKLGYSIRNISKKGYHGFIIHFALKGKKRNLSEAAKIVLKNNPNVHKHTEESKKKLSIQRKKWLNKNKHKNIWRFRKESYAEKLMRQFLQEEYNNYKIIQEYSPKEFKKTYVMDFAFINEKIDIEVNGKQHYKNNKFTDKHMKRENYIIKNGWRVININANSLINDYHNTIKIFNNIIMLKKFKSKNINCIILQEQFEIENAEKIKDDIIQLYKNNYSQQEIMLNLNCNYKQLIYIINKYKLSRDIRFVGNARKKINFYIETFKNSNIDINKKGFIKELCNLWNVSHTQVRRIMMRDFPNEYKKAFHKNLTRSLGC